MPKWLYLDRAGVRLAVADFGGSGSPVVLLHGLAGHAEEWAETAAWLREKRHVFALDLRGHGRSERAPHDVSLSAHIDDVAAAIQCIGTPVALVGHSVSGIIAIVVAADRPHLVAGLVVSDASAAGGDALSAASAADDLRESLGRWPVPFGSREEAIQFFGGPSVAASAWTEGLEEREDGLWPRFDIDVMVRMLREIDSRSHWDTWERISSPTLLVRAGNGLLSTEDAGAMAERLPLARLVEVPGARHDVHLDRPEEWRRALSRFLTELD
jgi:pimeloyl-ACP methyl ester carboxylesterase